MSVVADLWIGSDSFETDESRTTRTSRAGGIVAGTAVAISIVFLFIGIDPKFYLSDGVTSISGDRIWNSLGWALGAVVVPLVVVVAHQVELRQALSPDHIKVSSRTKWLGVALVLGLFVSTLHAFLASASIKFGG